MIAVSPLKSSILDLLIPNRAIEGDQILHYRIQELIGEGGMGAVFTAFDERLERTVAIKVLKPHLAAQPAARQRFLQEARALASVRHQNVVVVFAVEDAALPFIVMERLEGTTLMALLEENNAVTPLQTVEIGHQVACGLAAAHRAGVVHRDIKPHNILIENGVVKLLDFGLAHTLRQQMQTNGVAGTPYYMAPEQIQDEPIDERTDIYALGIVLYRMLSNQFPFGELSRAAALVAISTRDAPPLTTLQPQLPTELAQLVDRLIDRHPDKRVQTASEVASALQTIATTMKAGRWVKAVKLLTNRQLWLTVAASIVPLTITFASVAAIIPDRVTGQTATISFPSEAFRYRIPKLARTEQVLAPSEMQRWSLISTDNSAVPSNQTQLQAIRFMAKFDVTPPTSETLLHSAELSISPTNNQSHPELRVFMIDDSVGIAEVEKLLKEHRALTKMTGLIELGSFGSYDEQLAGNSSFSSLCSEALISHLREQQSGGSVVIVADSDEDDQRSLDGLRMLLRWQSDAEDKP